MTDISSLVLAARRGEPRAFVELVRRHSAMVSAVALSIVGDIDRSEDAAQTALLLAWQRLDQLDDPARFSGWLRQIVRNVSRQAARRHQRYTKRIICNGDAVDAAAERIDLDRDLDRANLSRVIAAALDGLDEPSRASLILYYREDLDAQEIAQHLGLSHAAVRKRLSRARARLRDVLAAQLRVALKQTRLGSVFFSTIAALIAGPAARAAPRPRKVRSPKPLLRAFMLGGLVLFAGHLLRHAAFPVSEPSAALVSTTAISSRSRPVLPAPAHFQETSEPESIEEAPLAPYFFNVDLTRYAGGNQIYAIRSGLRASDFFPAAEDGAFPDFQTVALLERQMAREASVLFGTFAEDPELLDIAQEELSWQDPEVWSSPWRALLMAEVNRRVAGAALRRAQLSGDPGMLRPIDDNIMLAESMLARDLEPRLADAFRLYLLDAVMPGRARGPSADREYAWDVLTEIIETSEDPAVVATALERFCEDLLPPRGALSPEKKATLRAAVAALQPPRPITVHRVSRLLLRQAIREEDWAQARVALEQSRAATAQLCPEWAIENLSDLNLDEDVRRFCAEWTALIDTAAGRFAAMEGWQPAHWRPGIVEAAWQCHTEAPLTAALHVETRVEDGEWRWSPWPIASDFTRCLDDRRPSLAFPTEGRVVTLRFVP